MRFSLPLYLLLLGVVLFSCKKPVLNENGTLPANSLGALFTDTLTVRTSTVLQDTLFSSNQAVSILGVINEPTFGKSSASIYTQFALPVNNLNLGTNLVVDSVVLTLKYLGYYGDARVPMNVRVYRMADRIYYDSSYYSGRTFNTQTALLGVLNNALPDLTDSVYNHYKDDTLGHLPSMKIRLDNTLGQDLLNQSGSSNVVDNNAWLNYFNGLYITVDTTRPGGNMVYVDMRSTETQLRVYYKGDNVDSLITFYATTATAQTVNHYTHNYANSSVATVLGSTNPNGDSLMFCQSMAGVKGKVTIPYLHDFVRQQGNIAINKAELMFTNIGDGSTYTLPYQITAWGISSTGIDTILYDQTIGANYFGGYVAVENSLDRYRIDLAHYYQGIAQGNTDNGIFITTTPEQRIADRVPFGGGTHSRYKVKLNLTYTKIH